MAERTATTVNRTSTAERRENMGERIWRSTEYLVRGRFAEANEALVEKSHDADRLGKIRNFEYEDTEPVRTFVEKQFTEQRYHKLRKFGKSAIK